MSARQIKEGGGIIRLLIIRGVESLLLLVIVALFLFEKVFDIDGERKMLVDFISPETLPPWVVWFDWCFYTYELEFFIFIIIGIVGWIAYCLFNQGLGVG